MSQRSVALIDADLNVAAHLQTELARHGLAVEIAEDCNELMARKEDLPTLVVLCIDPKRTGWAVCNRLRKSPLLKSVPLIITSAEATEKDFDDHKKLKTRAEEYLHKPFGADALLEKIGSLIGFPEVSESEIEVEADEIGVEIEPEEIGVEIATEEVSIPVAAEPAKDTSGFGPQSEDESTRVGFTAEIDGEVDLETNAAFAAIGLDDPVEAASASASPFDDDSLPDVPEPAPAPKAVAAPPAPAPTPPAPAPAPPPRKVEEDSGPVPRQSAADLNLEEVARDAAALVASTPPPSRPSEPVDDGALASARSENDRLRKELDELRARASKAEPAAAAGSSSFSREREFLTLRETINKKEKEVLDLKDALDSRERQILDGKEKLRENEKRLREVEEKSLGTERELVAAREKVEALSADKERNVEREKQLKARLEDTQKGLQKSEGEVEKWQTKHATETAALEEKYNQAVTKQREDSAQQQKAHAEALATLAADHQALVETAQEEHESDKMSLEASHAEALSQLRSEHEDMVRGLRDRQVQELGQKAAEYRATMDTELKAAERKHAEAIVDLETRAESTLRESTEKHQADARAQAEEARRTLEQVVSEHLAERGEVEAEQARAIEAIDLRRTEELAAAAAQAAEAQTAALAAAAAQHEVEIKGVREQHSRKLQALEESHDDLKAGMQSRHAAQLEELKKQQATAIAEFESAIAERDQIINQQRERQAELEAEIVNEKEQAKNQTRRFGSLEGELEAARQELEARQKTLGDRASRIAELEEESARYQDQILRAYQRIKSDENIVSRAKKALAIALTLLEENGPESTEDAKS